MQRQQSGYRIVIRALDAGEGGGFLVEVPALPGCMSDGETPAMAVENVKDAIAAWVDTAQGLGCAIPGRIF